MWAMDAYADEDAGADRRTDERAAFDIVDAKLQHVIASAQNAGAKIAAVDAAYHVRILWAALIGDLGAPDNALDPNLRASLISVGLRMLDCAERLRDGDVAVAEEISDVGRIVAQGLSAGEIAA